ncbi:MAG TPA: DUF2235 domain-containing protein [Vitreimonas sp.]|uniref:DUF2235 domain-containing protein n=1 Tax=Vitreimonas sp. TaxID=3069702 RepID=UPI002D4C6E3D|nr:DUF2235 domain-containing protein [Vitreimonas sp.]HYD89421.1 DUF2235 domain-containing protein [Vitreimonas sp.]
MKRIVICCDGTWQRLYNASLTNVALTARAVAPRDARGVPQIVYYSAGVGASMYGVSIWQGMTGADLDDHLLDAYLFLNLNYEPGDEIYLFGFSRGAYTVRSLAGLLRKCGVLRRAHVDKARAALELYRHREVSADTFLAARFRAAHAIAWPRLGNDGATIDTPPVDLRLRYVGVWDTVGSLGIPRVLPISVGLNQGYLFHDTTLSRAVHSARHAVAIDEQRAAFAPTLWSNVDAFNTPGARPRVMQSWFPGDHGAVGGNDDSRGLSNCALLWVLEGAEQVGLALMREPGSIISAAMAEIDPLNAALLDRRRSMLDLAGRRWRAGLSNYGDLHEVARLRWMADRHYRPKPMLQFAREIAESLREAA